MLLTSDAEQAASRRPVPMLHRSQGRTVDIASTLAAAAAIGRRRSLCEIPTRMRQPRRVTS
jgi:hypothetical protein